VQERHADEGRIDSAFNAFGDKVSSAERVTGSRTVVTNYTYDKLSRLTQTSLAQGITRYEIGGADGTQINPGITQTVLETNQYDEAGRKVRVVNGNNEATRYRYDRAGNVVLSGQETVKDAGADRPAVALAYQMRYRYDALGRKVGQTDAAGMNQAWTYDTFGRLIGRTDSKTGGGTVDYTYVYNRAGDLTHEGNGSGKSLDYRYDGAGQRIEIRDNNLGQTTRYGYDLAGNRVSEKMAQKTLLSSGVLDNVVYQDNHLVYDAQNRLRAVFDSRADVRITYDLAGNRSQVTTHVINTIRPDAKSQPANVVVQDQQVIHTSTTAYGYDAMNRQIRSQEVSSVTGAVDTHKYRYDYAGNRIQDETYSGGPIEGSPNGKLVKTYEYVYDDLNRVVKYKGYGVSEDTDQILFDGAGRQVYARSLVMRGAEEKTPQYENRYNQYDAMGKLQDTHVVIRGTAGDVVNRVDVAYHDAGGATGLGYDAAGNLLGNRQVSDGDQGNATTTRYDYQSLNGSYQQTGSTATRGSTSATTKTWRDANGFVSNIEQTTGAADERFNRAFVNDAQGNAVYVNQGAGHTGRIQNQPGGYLGGWVGDSLNPGHVQRQLVANGEVLARYGDAPDSENPANPGEIPKYVDTAEFRLNAAPLKLKGANLDAIAYTVVGGETLKDIARNVLGDAKLWWRIAEANGLAVSGDGQLAEGQTLSVPKLALNANNVDTFQPYDPSRVTGSMAPNLPAPAGQGGGCGGLGKIIMVAIAVVVTIYTAGALAAAGSLGTNALGAATLAGTTTGGGFAATMAAGASVLGGGAGIGAAVAAGVAGGAMGSIASQVTGNAIGAQDGFSWKGVALSALSGGVAGGLAGTTLLGGSGLGVSVARATLGNAMSQGIGIVTGLQNHFDWRSVAASAAGAGVGASVGQALQSADAFSSLGGGFGTDLARGAVSGFAGGVAAAVMRGGRVSVQQVATDAFGNALGQSLAYSNGQASGSGSGMQEDRLGAFIGQQETAQDQRDMWEAQSSFRTSEIEAQNQAQAQARSDALYGWSKGTDGSGFKAGAEDWDRALTQTQPVQDPVATWKDAQVRNLVRTGDYSTAAELRAADVRLTSEGLRIYGGDGGVGSGGDLAFQPPVNPQLQRLLQNAELASAPAEAPAANGMLRGLNRLVKVGGVGLSLATFMRDPETSDWQAAGSSFSYNRDDFTLRIADATTGAKLAVPGIYNPSQYNDAQYLAYVTYKANGGQLSINDYVSVGTPDGVGQSISKANGFDVTDSVAISGKRAIDLGKSYESGIRALYGNDVSFAERSYQTIVNGKLVNGIADHVIELNGQRTAVEAKFVEDWNTSLRNPDGSNGSYPWSVREQQKMLNQAAKYSAFFDGGVIYHTNSVDFATHYTNMFTKLGVDNFRFVITPAIRK